MNGKRVIITDGDSFRRLHEETYNALFYYMYTQIQDKYLSEDILQESYVLLWEKRESFDNLMAIKSFLYQTAQNKLKSHLRDEATHKRILNAELKEILPGTGNDHLVMEAEVAAQIMSAIEELPAQTRRVAILTMQGMSVNEIAEILSISSNTVKTLKKSVYKSLRGKLSHLRSALMLISILFG